MTTSRLPRLADDLIAETLRCPCDATDGPLCARCECLVELAHAIDIYSFEQLAGVPWHVAASRIRQADQLQDSGHAPNAYIPYDPREWNPAQGGLPPQRRAHLEPADQLPPLGALHGLWYTLTTRLLQVYWIGVALCWSLRQAWRRALTGRDR